MAQIIQSEHNVSNDHRMWIEYHTRRFGTVTHLLHLLKTKYICRMFADRILSLSGPISSVLELGCGTASTLNQIHKQTGAVCLGVDCCSEAIRIAAENYPHLKLEDADIFDLEYPRKSFDLVYSVGLLEHFSHGDQMRLLQIHNDLAKKCAVLMVPADGIVFNTIIAVNKRLLRRSGTWADEQVFSAKSLREDFPEHRFQVSKDMRFLNMVLWFAWRVEGTPAT